MHRFLRFSLKTLLIAITTFAVAIYFFLPIETEICCDVTSEFRRNPVAPEILIDIEGRNKTKPFITIVKGATVISSEPSPDFKYGQVKLKIYMTLHAGRNLRNYEIFRVRKAR